MLVAIDILILMIIFVIMVFMIIQFKLDQASLKKKFGNLKSSSKLSGVEVSRKILDANNLETTYVLENTKNLRNYYHLSRQVIYLNRTIFNGEDLLSLALAVYKTMPLLDDNKIFRLKRFLSPIFNIINYFGYIMLLISIITKNLMDIKTTIIIFIIVFSYNLLFLPVDINNAKLAKTQLIKLKILNATEEQQLAEIFTVINKSCIGDIVDNLINDIKFIIKQLKNKR